MLDAFSFRYRVNVPPYRGSDARKRMEYQEKLRIAARITEVLMQLFEDMEEGDSLPVFAHDLASKLGEHEEIVRRLMQGVQGGHHGLTMHKTGMR